MDKTKKLKVFIIITYFVCFLFLLTDVFIFYTKINSKTKVSQNNTQDIQQTNPIDKTATDATTNSSKQSAPATTPAAISATIGIPQVTDEGSTPDNCYLHVKTPFTIHGSGSVKVTNVETTNLPDFGPFSDSIDTSYTGTLTNDVSEKSAWYGNQGVIVYFHLEIYDQNGSLLTSSPIVPYTCP